MSESQAKALRACRASFRAMAEAVQFYFGDEMDEQDTAGLALRDLAKDVLASLATSHQSPAPLRPERGGVTALSPEQIADPSRFFCPHCGAFRPPTGFNFQRHAIPGIGVIDYMIIYCGMEDCRVMLSIAMIQIVPDPGAVAAAGGRKVHLS